MKIKVTLRVNIRKFYQFRFCDDYYYLLNENEKHQVRSSIKKDNLKILLFNNGSFHGDVTINDMRFEEKDGHLLLHLEINIVNKDNYTGKYIRKIINDTVWHYAKSGPSFNWSDSKYYKIIDEDYDISIHNHNDLTSDQIEEITKEEYEESRNKYTVGEISYEKCAKYGKGEGTFLVENIIIEDEDQWDKMGTNVCQLKRNCKCNEGVYYGYVYNNESCYDCIDSTCLTGGDTSVEGLKKQLKKAYGMKSGYYKITDYNHNVIIEGLCN